MKQNQVSSVVWMVTGLLFITQPSFGAMMAEPDFVVKSVESLTVSSQQIVNPILQEESARSADKPRIHLADVVLSMQQGTVGEQSPGPAGEASASEISTNEPLAKRETAHIIWSAQSIYRDSILNREYQTISANGMILLAHSKVCNAESGGCLVVNKKIKNYALRVVTEESNGQTSIYVSNVMSPSAVSADRSKSKKLERLRKKQPNPGTVVFSSWTGF